MDQDPGKLDFSANEAAYRHRKSDLISWCVIDVFSARRVVKVCGNSTQNVRATYSGGTVTALGWSGKTCRDGQHRIAGARGGLLGHGHMPGCHGHMPGPFVMKHSGDCEFRSHGHMPGCHGHMPVPVHPSASGPTGGPYQYAGYLLGFVTSCY